RQVLLMLLKDIHHEPARLGDRSVGRHTLVDTDQNERRSKRERRERADCHAVGVPLFFGGDGGHTTREVPHRLAKPGFVDRHLSFLTLQRDCLSHRCYTSKLDYTRLYTD